MATIASLVIKIGTDLSAFLSDTERVKSQLGSIERSTATFGSKMSKAGQALLPMSAAVGAMGGLAVKAAIDFESSFAGVRKTVSDAVDEFGNLTETGQRLRDGFRTMATEIPVSTDELNKIGEAAGQLGIESENILGFTRVMADLGVTTNLTSEAAATALARFANITQMPQDQFDELGSTIVALGNNFATTESEIVDFGLRIAGAGELAGLSEAQIMAIGTAMSSVGIEAEAGGTAVQKVLNDMTAAVAQGGESLELFAATAGMSADDFAAAYRENAAGAFSAFVTGLGTQGDQAFTTLDNLKLGNERVIRAFLSLGQAGDLLTNTLTVADQAWANNTALTHEAEQRYRTTSAQLALLWNNLKDVAITLGEALLPFVQAAIEKLRAWIPAIQGVAEWFADLSPWLQTTILAIGGLVAAAGPVLIVLGSMATGISAIAAVIPILVTALGTVLPFLGPAGLIAVGVAAVVMAWRHWDEIVAFVQKVYAAVRDYFGAKLQAIFDGVKGKIDAVTGWFKGMYEAVVGHSYVPDMIDGIESEFARLDVVMVEQSAQAAAGVTSVFSSLKSALGSSLGDLNAIFQRAFEGGGGIGGAIQSMATNVTQSILSLIPGVGAFLSQFSGAIVAGAKRLWSAIAGGPSEAELAGREAAHKFSAAFAAQLTAAQQAEAMMQAASGASLQWAQSVIYVRDALNDEALALQLVDELWRAEKEGPEAVAAVIAKINGLLDETVAKNAVLAEAAKKAAGDIAALEDPLDRMRAKLDAADIVLDLEQAVEDFGKTGRANVSQMIRWVQELERALGTDNVAVQMLREAMTTWAETGVLDIQKMLAAFQILKGDMEAGINIPVEWGDWTRGGGGAAGAVQEAQRRVGGYLTPDEATELGVPYIPRSVYDEAEGKNYHYAGEDEDDRRRREQYERDLAAGLINLEDRIYLHQGGVVDFAKWRRAHSGMLAWDEVPTVLQTGEGVVSRRGMSRLGTSGLHELNSGGGGGSQASVVAELVAVRQEIAGLRREWPQRTKVALKEAIEGSGRRRSAA